MSNDQGTFLCTGGCYTITSCTYQGSDYPVGAHFAASDGINYCDCSGSGAVCSQR